MKKLNIPGATISALIVWVIGVAAFVCSYLIPVMENPETQANWVLAVALIPATALGAHLYFKKGFHTNGFVLGSYMFGLTILLDACITVPVFVFPEGGNHLTFFGDPVFWLIGLEYIALITLYWMITGKVKPSEVNSTM